MDWQGALYKGYVALFLVLLLMFWQIKESMHLVDAYRLPTTVEDTFKPSPLPHAIDIASLHLFGKAASLGGQGDQLPLTDLNFTIVGIFHAEKPALSQVLLDTGDGNAERFSVGDLLPEGVTLSKILTDSVILERDGHYESLPLDKNKLTFEGPPSELPVSNDR